MSGRPLRILFIDDCVPHKVGGRGYPRANEIVRQFVTSGHTVTLYPLVVIDEPLAEAYADIPRNVEIILRAGVPLLASALSQLAMHIDVIWVSRPHNMRWLIEALAQVPGLRNQIVLLYDAEAIYAEREVLKRRLCGETVDPAAHEAAVAAELELARAADALISVSAPERRKFEAGTGLPTFAVNVPTPEVAPSSAAFGERSDLLFVGSVRADSPNEDGLLWLLAEAFREIHARCGARLRIAGEDESEAVRTATWPAVERLGVVPDLAPLFNEARIFVAPTRYAAGVPQKLADATAYGLPAIVTPLLAQQLERADGDGFLVAENAPAFAEKTVRLYQDEGLWNELRAATIARAAYDREHGSVARQLEALYAWLGRRMIRSL